MKHLEEAAKILESLIAKTPTGELRNSLTDVNILIRTSMEEIQNEPN